MKYFFFLLLLAGCSTYVPVEYRTPSEYPAKKDSYVQIIINKESSFTPAQKLTLAEDLGLELNNDGWLRYKKDKSPKQLYEIVINQFEINSEAKLPSTETVDKRTYRTASYRAIGNASFSIKRLDEDVPTQFNISSNTIVASRVELPDILGAYSRVGVFSTLMGTNSEADVIEKQDKALSMEALIEAKTRVFEAIKSKITPVKNIVKIKLEDDRDDMEELKSLLKENDLTGAVIYLDYLNAQERRSDVFYNLGVVYEALGYFSEACNYYKEAYALSAKSMYLEQKAGCELRLQQFSLLPF
jgi:tetratricopeptide (TPR) repeat protein